MNKAQAKRVKESLMCWGNPKLVCIEPGNWTVEATEPLSNRRMTYNNRSGYFE